MPRCSGSRHQLKPCWRRCTWPVRCAKEEALPSPPATSLWSRLQSIGAGKICHATAGCLLGKTIESPHSVEMIFISPLRPASSKVETLSSSIWQAPIAKLFSDQSCNSGSPRISPMSATRSPPSSGDCCAVKLNRLSSRNRPWSDARGSAARCGSHPRPPRFSAACLQGQDNRGNVACKSIARKIGI